jgi:rubrerythrin
MSNQFYLQDSRGYVGNDVLWWAKNGHGYTTDLSKAHIYTKDEAVKRHESRYTDIPWPKDYIDAKTRPAVDMQYINREEALSGTGIKLLKPPKEKKDTYKCVGCGRFLTIRQNYGECPNCGKENRP